MITAHILTKNNQDTVKSTLESLQILNPRILVGDLGSTDGTLSILKKFNVEILNIRESDRSQARQILAEKGDNDWNLWIEPWEIIFQNPKSYQNIKKDFAYVRIINNQIFNWELRLWRKNCRFANPIFETIEENDADICGLIISSKGGLDMHDTLINLEKWKKNEPLNFKPYYYQSCLLLSGGNYDEFLKVVEHYLFLDKSSSVSSTMARYYYALVLMTHKKSVKAALQNINICLCVNPLMAEFWCLMADVYYHLLNNFSIAKEFYENAIILGSHRLTFDKWPMDITKYNKYPNKMIKSCEDILKNKANFIPIQNTPSK
jgi:tetratricopeptide (TPR) repeat protein